MLPMSKRVPRLYVCLETDRHEENIKSLGHTDEDKHVSTTLSGQKGGTASARAADQNVRKRSEYFVCIDVYSYIVVKAFVQDSIQWIYCLFEKHIRLQSQIFISLVGEGRESCLSIYM